MDFFIMWLCFYTYCILALYVGSWDTQHMNPNYRGSDNARNHRQVRQENRQFTRQNTFSPLLENDDVLTISLWKLFYKSSRLKLLINKFKYRKLTFEDRHCLVECWNPDPWIVCRVTISTMSSFQYSKNDFKNYFKACFCIHVCKMKKKYVVNIGISYFVNRK